MINSTAFGERLKVIMEYYALNASSFADKIGVQRSGISHILAGRNKPSLDFILKIIDAFNDVDLYWLLIGKGNFPPSGNEMEPEAKTKIETPVPSSENTVLEIPGLLETKVPEVEEKIQASKIKEKKGPQITKIILLYENGNFDSFEN